MFLMVKVINHMNKTFQNAHPIICHIHSPFTWSHGSHDYHIIKTLKMPMISWYLPCIITWQPRLVDHTDLEREKGGG